MPTTQEERLREKFYQEWNTDIGNTFTIKSIADFWLSKIADLRKEWVEEARRDIKKKKKGKDYFKVYAADYNEALSDILALPSFNPLPTSK